MKSKITYLGLMAILFSACSTGSYVSSSYTDDIYFNPGEVPPPIVVASATSQGQVAQKSSNTMILSEINENDEGINTMDNYVFEGTEDDESALLYGMEQESDGVDTISYYEDGEVKYLIDNYIDDNGNVDYAYRINRFHNPYFYDPFYWDTWYYDPYCYYPGWSMSFNWGWGYPYYGWGYPGYGWGYPHYGWGYPGYGWGYPGYGWGGGYYPPYPSHPIYPGGGRDYAYGQRRSSGTNVDRNRRGSSTGVAQNASGRNKSGSTEINRDTNTSNSARRTSSSSGLREGSERNGVSTKSNSPNTNILTEKRRTSGQGTTYSRQSGVEKSANSNASRSTTQSYTRPGANSQSRSYTRPSSSSSSVSTQPRVVNRSSSTGYSQPKSSSTYNQSYRSSSTYNRSSSTGTSSRTYRSSTPSSSSYRSSTPVRSSSSSSGSYSSGSSGSRSSGASYSGSSGSSSRSSSSGGGGSRSSGGGSSSSGRR